MITLIGKDLAEKGNRFVFYGPSEECESCRFKSSCINSLEENRVYEIIDIIDNEQKCELHNGNIVVPVEVKRADIEILTNSRNTFEGSTFRFNAPDCDETCEFKKYCFPEGIFEDDKCIIIKNNGKHNEECKKGYKLNKLTLGFVI